MAFTALWVIIGLFILYVLAGLRVVKEYERGIRFTFGKYSGIIKPGLREIWPIIQTWQRVDIRVKAIDVPDQDAITKDNVSINVNAVLYYKVADTTKAVLEIGPPIRAANIITAPGLVLRHLKKSPSLPLTAA